MSSGPYIGLLKSVPFKMSCNVESINVQLFVHRNIYVWATIAITKNFYHHINLVTD